MNDKNENIINRNGFEFRCTCLGYPEQYDVFQNGTYIAYVRKRFGVLTVNPVKNGEIVWDTVIHREVDSKDPLMLSGTIDNLYGAIDKITSAILRFNKRKVWVFGK